MKEESLQKLRRWGKLQLLRILIAAKPVSRSTIPKFTLRLMKIGFDGAADQDGFISPYKYDCKAASVISVDFEHLHDTPGKNSLNHKGTLAILHTAEKYGIPLTWAVCGEAAVKDHEAYEQILNSKVKHDIAVHTYSHRDLSDPTCTEVDVQDEISKCIEVLDGAPRPSTFIFPYNNEDHFDVIRKNGFTSYRPMERVFGYPRKRNEMWCIPPTYYLNEDPTNLHSELAGRLIDSAIAYGCIFHLWLHPRSIAMKGSVEEYVDSVLEPIFQYMNDKSKQGLLWLCTMRELANYCEAKENCSITKYEMEYGGYIFFARCRASNASFDTPPEVTVRIPVSDRAATVKVGGIGVPQREILTSVDGGRIVLTLAFEKQLKSIDVS